MSSRSSIIASVIIVAIVFGSVGGLLYITRPYEPSRVAIVVMSPGFGDFSYADQLKKGLDSLGSTISVQYEFPDFPTTAAEAQQTLEELAQSGKYVLIVGVGADMASSLQTVAAKYPNQHFAMIDGHVDAPNVASATFKVEQASFLAGVVAAFMANTTYNKNGTGKIGIIGSYETDPDVMNMIKGFTQGVEHANQTYALGVELLDPLYIESFNNTALASTYTVQLFIQQHVTIIFAPVRASMKGVREGMEIANRTSLFLTGRAPLVIAAGGDQDYLGNPNPEIDVGPSWIPVSVVPRTDLAAYTILNATLWNDFPGGTHYEYDLANGGVTLTNFTYSTTYVPKTVRSIVWDYYDDIINGVITVDV
ncbi:MAG: BMP family lipoprotein [Candidatus Thorarchaeota archaeon]